ncbi:MAG: helix-turn-helix domain-containing protein [Pelagimonas sp.]|uniref:helix-turn-helix domain-containing protein n=1 Tax=Pelagimonas sp. TaxID=2073170 RepID=UPI003D6A9C87
MDKILLEMISIATLAITVFGVAFCLLQTQYSRVSQSFAAFLAAIAVNNLPDAFSQLIGTLPQAYAFAADMATWPSSFLLAPLFWLYVFVLTSQGQQWPTKLKRHAFLPVSALVVTILTLASPQTVREALSSSEPEFTAAWTLTLAALFTVLQLAVYPQIAIYLYLILRRLMNFRLKLRDVYASTEQHELRWIYVIGGLAILFWITQALLLIFAFGSGESRSTTAFLVIASLAGFALVGAVTLWGLRQRPPLEPDGGDNPKPGKGQPTGKYEKSALSTEASERLSRKLRLAMEVDHLHRDPNLSLWALATHTGASANYISQTLNEMIGKSFFDFVNGYRIAEAKTLLSTTNESVLNITYDVGFNARSSFYNAFKRETGQTPTAYRKKMSQPEGMDDIKVPQGDT